jgi:hypothetical protein
MSQEPEAILRKSLDAVDRFRTRAIAGLVFLFVTTLLALGSLMGAASRASGSAGQAKILFTSVAAQMIFVALCTVLVSVQISRMTRTILKAIELTSTK